MTPTHYIRENGSDANNGLTPATAWRTIGRAMTGAPSGAVVEVGPGHILGHGVASGATNRYQTISFYAQYPALDDDRRPINAGLHTVIEGGLRCGPPGNGVVPAAPWTEVQLVGPTDGVARTVWKWASVGTASRLSLGWGTTRDAVPKRVIHWKTDALLLATPAGWAELVATNRTQRHGYYQSGSDLYLYAPHIADPNALWWTAGTGCGVSVSAPDCRFSGLVLRGSDTAIQFGPFSDRFEVDHCWIQTSNNGIKTITSSAYSCSGIKIHDNLMQNTGLWSDDQVNDPSMAWIAAKGKIKVDPAVHTYPDNRYPTTRLCGALEGVGIYVSAVDHASIYANTVEGFCNGIGAMTPNHYTPEAGTEIDVHDNVIRQIADDAIEFEQRAVNLRVYRNEVTDALTFMSTGPTHVGPVHVWGNRARIGMRGLARDLDGVVDGAASLFFKYSRASSPQAHIYVIGNTMRDDGESVVSGGAQFATGSGVPEFYHLANNVLVVSADAWQWWPGHLDEHDNQFVTSDPSRGFKRLSDQTLYTTMAAYQAASGQGQGSNPLDLHDPAAVEALLDEQLHLTPAGQLALPGVLCPGVLGSPAMGSAA
jgi:hypothetical protein